MKEYKIIKQKGGFLSNTDSEFEDELNKLAREGWQVISAVHLPDRNGLKVILEKDKNR